MDLGFAEEVDSLAALLDQLDYFQLLKLEPTASLLEIKGAFHRESRLYHPDRYHALPESPLKTNVNKVYKRVTEAYVTLRDDVKRQKYLTDIHGPDRDKKLRFTEADAAEAQQQNKKAHAEQFGTTLKGRQLYQQALRDIEGAKLEAALRNLKMAATFEPGTQLFKDKLVELEATMKATAKGKK
jgi:DnaJ-class molecular chaperone